jgi:hypothetical protein
MGLATPKNLLRYPEDFLRYPEELSSAEESYRAVVIGGHDAVPDNINPTTVKPIEVSFIWYSCIVSARRANVLQRIGFLDKVSLLRMRKKPGTARTGASNANRSSVRERD